MAFQFNPFTGTFDIVHRGLTVRLLANCLGVDNVGDCVVIRAPAVGERIQVKRSNPRIQVLGPSIGLIVEKTSATECVVQTMGEVKDLYTAQNSGSQLWVGLDGRLQDTNASILPSAGKCFVQQLGQALSPNVVWIHPQQPLTKVDP